MVPAFDCRVKVINRRLAIEGVISELDSLIVCRRQGHVEAELSKLLEH